MRIGKKRTPWLCKSRPLYEEGILDIGAFFFFFFLSFSSLPHDFPFEETGSKMIQPVEECPLSVQRIIYISTVYMKPVMLLITFSLGQRVSCSEMGFECPYLS